MTNTPKQGMKLKGSAFPSGDILAHRREYDLGCLAKAKEPAAQAALTLHSLLKSEAPPRALAQAASTALAAIGLLWEAAARLADL